MKKLTIEKLEQNREFNKTDDVTNIENKTDNTNSRRYFLKRMGVGGVAFASGVTGLTPTQTAHAKLVNSSSINTKKNKSWFGNWSNNTTSSDKVDTNAITNDSSEQWQEKPWGETTWEEPATPAITCIPATIATRLFSSSNASISVERNDLAIQRLTCAGFKVDNPEIMSRKYYRFGGTDRQRSDDFNSIANGRVVAPKLLLGVRGGYGAMRILQDINWQRLGRVMQERGTILGGFSDVTAIQCALFVKGRMGSANLPMAYSEFGKPQPDPISCGGFVKAITDKNLVLHTIDSSLTSASVPTIMNTTGNSKSRIQGTIWGGNLSVLSSLAGSDYMPRPKGGIVFIEEVGEQPYRLERMLYDMYLAGAFKNQQAIVFGAMARIAEDVYDPSYDVSAVIRELQSITGLPIYNGVGFGHVSKKQSFPMGCQCEIVTTGSGFDMKFSGYPTIDNVSGQIKEEALSMTT